MVHRYPEKTITSAEIAIAALDAHKEVIANSSDLHEIWTGISEAARKLAEMEKPDWSVIKALWIIADACSLRLQAENTDAPFAPFCWFGDRRSAIVDDFHADDVAIFSALAPMAGNRNLRARLADLAWLLSRPRRISDAELAIDSYLSKVPSEDDLDCNIGEWRRAIVLCKQMGRGAGERLVQISTELINQAIRSLENEGDLGFALAQLVFDCKIQGDEIEKIPEHVARQGQRWVDEGSDFFKARNFLGLSHQWFLRLGEVESAADTLLTIAKSYEKEADARIAKDNVTGYLAAQSFLGDAIQTLRKVARNQRPARQVDAEIGRLSRRLTEVGHEAAKSMQIFSSGSTDISEIVAIAERAVSGKNKLEALVGFANLHSGASISKMTANAEDSLRKFAFSRLAGSTHITEEGRVVAKTPAAKFQEGSGFNSDAIFAKIMEHHALDINFIGQGMIIPAWKILAIEHVIAKSDIGHLVASSPIVPPDRVEQFTKGIWEGFDGDFATAIYLLAPQLEGLVRWHLKGVGAQTVNRDLSGIENELGLSTLVDMPDLKKVFDENTIFQIKAIFCTALGPNFRNEVAHGLLNSEAGRSVASIYAWWWIFRLVLRSCINSLNAQRHKETPPTAEVEGVRAS